MQAFRQQLSQSDPDVFAALIGEELRQVNGVELIPSENYTYPEVLELLGSIFTNKYSEGYPGRRYYGGQEYTDVIERLAVERAIAVFGGGHANVQPLSGSAMNQAAYLALLDPGDTILAMDLSHGGHLTHGAPVSHMGRIFNFVRYQTELPSGQIDFDKVRTLAVQHKPKLIVCGHSSYPLELNYQAFKSIADDVGAYTMADVSHIGGLIAGGVLENPMDFGFDVLTTTTHKSLRGPRGGLIVCTEALARAMDKSVFPGLQGGPHMNQVAATALTLRKAAQPEFKEYCQQVLNNAQTLATSLSAAGVKLIAGGTQNHLLVIDVMASYGLDGQQAQELLDKVGITTNKQVIPDEPLTPMKPSGIRIGTPAATTRGFATEQMQQIAKWMHQVLTAPQDSRLQHRVAGEIKQLCQQYPVWGIADRP